MVNFRKRNLPILMCKGCLLGDGCQLDLLACLFACVLVCFLIDLLVCLLDCLFVCLFASAGRLVICMAVALLTLVYINVLLSLKALSLESWLETKNPLPNSNKFLSPIFVKYANIRASTNKRHTLHAPSCPPTTFPISLKRTMVFKDGKGWIGFGGSGAWQSNSTILLDHPSVKNWFRSAI